MHGNQNAVAMPRILVAAQDHELRALLRHTLERAAYEVDACTSRCELRNVLASFAGSSFWKPFDLLLFEKQVLDQNAVDAIRGLQRRQCAPPLVLVKSWRRQSGAAVQGLTIAAVIDEPTDAAKCKCLVRNLAPHRTVQPRRHSPRFSL